MRARELLQESGYVNELQTEVNNLLTMLKANGMFEVKTEMLVAKLQELGYSVSVESLSGMLEGNPIVDAVEGDTVMLQGGEDQYGGGSEDSESESSAEDNQAKVADMAQKAAQKDL